MDRVIAIIVSALGSIATGVLIRLLYFLAGNIKDSRRRSAIQNLVKAAEQRYMYQPKSGTEKYEWVKSRVSGKIPDDEKDAMIEAAVFDVSAKVKKELEYKTKGMRKKAYTKNKKRKKNKEIELSKPVRRKNERN